MGRPWMFALVTTTLVAGATGSMARLVSFYKPWRSTELVVLSAMAIACALAMSWVSHRRPRVRLPWMSAIAAGWLLVGAVHAWASRANHAVNVRPAAEYIEPSRIGLPAAETPVRLDQLATYFRTRDAVPLEKLPRIHLTLSDADDVETEALELMESRYRFHPYAAVELSDDLSWDEDPVGDSEWTWELHNMVFCAVLARAYAATGHLPFLERAEALILDWIEDNSSYAMEPPSPSSWNDHTTAIRLGSWLFFWETWSRSPAFSERKMEAILGSMIAHAERLADPGFYWERHNHGIDQDRALLGFALLFPEIRTSDEWKSLALGRLTLQFTQTISPNGVHLEHSPGYHLILMERVEDVARVVAEFGLEDALEVDLRDLLSKMARFAASVIQPNHRVVPVGDTGPDAPDLYPALLRALATRDPWLEYALTRGASGLLHDTVLAYREEGYAAIRDFGGGTLPYERSFYLFFTAASCGPGCTSLRTHKHADDLSFTLVYGGHEFLIESGRYSYQSDERRDYAVSSRAHNVVLIDGEGFTGWDSGLDDFSTALDHSVIRASHRNYEGFEHTRWIVHVQPARVVVIDELMPRGAQPGEHEFEQLFQLAPDLEWELDDERVGLRATPRSVGGGAPKLRITQLNAPGRAHVVRGQREPMMGWYSPEHNVLEPSPVAVFSARGEQALYVTLLELADDEQAEWIAGARFTPSDSGFLIEWSEGRGAAALDVRRTGEVSLLWH